MAALRFYEDEDQRHSRLSDTCASPDEACMLAFHLYAKFIAPAVDGRHQLEFRCDPKTRPGNGYMMSPQHHDKYRALVVVPELPDMLIICHELAHVWQEALTNKATRHNAMLRRLVDTLAAEVYVILRMGEGQ